MEKLEKNNNYAFVVRENRKGERYIVQSGNSLIKILLSKLKGNIVCASEYIRYMKPMYQEYVTKDNMIVKGSLEIIYSIKEPNAYASERYTTSILDAIVRTVLCEYFSQVEMKDKTYHEMSEANHNFTINYLRECVSTILPWISIESVELPQVKKRRFDDVNFVSFEAVIPQDFKYEKNMDAEYYKPQIIDVEDDLSSSNQFFPKRRFIAKDQCLYYCGRIKEGGIYKNENARGKIVNLGRHAYSSPAVVLSRTTLGKKENVMALYPVIVYDVTDLRLYLNHYLEICDLFNRLCKDIVRVSSKNNVQMEIIMNLQNMGASKITRDLKRFGIEPLYMMFAGRNPFVKQPEFITTEKDIIENITRTKK